MRLPSEQEWWHRFSKVGTLRAGAHLRPALSPHLEKCNDLKTQGCQGLRMERRPGTLGPWTAWPGGAEPGSSPPRPSRRRFD